MKARTLLSAAIPLLCPLLAPALVIDKPTFSITFGPDWMDGLINDPAVPIHTLADTVHDAPGFMQGMPITEVGSAELYLSNVTLTLAAQYTRTDTSEKQLGRYRFQTSGWTETDPEEADRAKTLRLYSLDVGGVSFIAWMSCEPEGAAAVAEFEAALATLQIKGVAVRDRRFRSRAAAAPAGATRLDLLGRARATTGRLPAGQYVLR